MTLTTTKQQIETDMNSPNWNKEREMTAGRPQAARPFESNAAATPVTEDELEAYRFRGTPLHRAAAPLVSQPLPAPHPGHGGNGRPGGHNDRIQAINEAVRQTSAWVAPLRQEISKSPLMRPKLPGQ